MYDKDGKLHDRREMLRVKIKSLAEEARIIRAEEKRTRGSLRDELHLHRVGIVRSAARSSHLAYGLIRGKPYERMEAKTCEGNAPDWTEVGRLCKKYGPADFKLPGDRRQQPGYGAGDRAPDAAEKTPPGILSRIFGAKEAA